MQYLSHFRAKCNFRRPLS